MRVLMLILILSVAAMQYQLWFAKGSLPKVWRLQQQLKQEVDKNNQLVKRNSVLSHEVTDLKKAKTALEERARTDLGMIREGEVYYQIIPKKQQS